MYCTKCGKQIDYDALVCKECCEKEREAILSSEASAEGAASSNAAAAPAVNEELYPDPNNRMYGFGKALTSTILGTVAFIFSYVAIVLTAIFPAAGLVFLFVTAAPAVIGVVFGISSIKCFGRRKSHCAKPIATLVLGIVGLAQAAFACFFLFLVLTIAVAII